MADEDGGAAGLPSVSVQLYSLRRELAADLSGSLDCLAEIGFRHVETSDFVDRPDELRTALGAAGLVASLGHATLLSDEVGTPDGPAPAPAPDVVFDAAARMGMTAVFDPFVAAERWLTLDGVSEIADRVNRLVDRAAGFGLTIGYHNHAQEFVADFDGRSAYERFLDLTDDRFAVELDLFWAHAGGQDVPDLARRLGGRLLAVHVKDGLVPTPNPWAPGAPELTAASFDQRPAGAGEVPVAAALRAASAVRYAVIEYDKAPGDVFDDVAASFAFLRDGGFAR